MRYRVCTTLPLTRQEMRSTIAGWKAGDSMDLETFESAREWCMSQIGGKTLGRCEFLTVEESCDDTLEVCVMRMGSIAQTRRGLIERWRPKA